MDIVRLRDYRNWIGKTPGEILEYVKKIKGKKENEKGWKLIFTKEAFPDTPTGLPRWAHRVRNYFNREPTILELKAEGSHAYFNLYKYDPKRGGFQENMALSGDVYMDELLTPWFQMDPGGAIYHFKHPKNPKAEAALQGALGQINTPVFKLISPDDSGGSIETIVDNPIVTSVTSTVVGGIGSLVGGGVFGKQISKLRSSTIGKGEKVNITSRIIKVYDFQGSYNYAETIDAGYDSHVNFDVTPHVKDEKGYLNPDERHSSLFSDSRKFKEYAPKENTPLAEQIKYP